MLKEKREKMKRSAASERIVGKSTRDFPLKGGRVERRRIWDERQRAPTITIR